MRVSEFLVGLTWRKCLLQLLAHALSSKRKWLTTMQTQEQTTTHQPAAVEDNKIKVWLVCSGHSGYNDAGLDGDVTVFFSTRRMLARQCASRTSVRRRRWRETLLGSSNRIAVLDCDGSPYIAEWCTYHLVSCHVAKAERGEFSTVSFQGKELPSVFYVALCQSSYIEYGGGECVVDSLRSVRRGHGSQEAPCPCCYHGQIVQLWRRRKGELPYLCWHVPYQGWAVCALPKSAYLSMWQNPKVSSSRIHTSETAWYDVWLHFVGSAHKQLLHVNIVATRLCVGWETLLYLVAHHWAKGSLAILLWGPVPVSLYYCEQQ